MEQAVTQSLFGGLFNPIGTEQQARLQAAGQPVNARQAVSGNIGFLGERMQQGIGGAFGQMPEVDRKRQVFQQLVKNMQQQGVDISTPDGMIKLAQQMSNIPGLEGEALAIRQQAAQMAQQAQMQGLATEKTRAEIERTKAETAKARMPASVQPRAKVVTDLGDRVRIEDPNTGNVTYEKKGAVPKEPTTGQPRAKVVTDLGDRVRIEDPNTGKVIYEQKGVAPKDKTKDELTVGYDKYGRYTNKYGDVFSSTEMSKRRTEVEEINKVMQTFSQVSSKDIKQAKGFDYTNNALMKNIGSIFFSKTYQAQLKITQSTLKELLGNLPPGVASDKDIAFARSSQPNFQDPDSVADWFRRAYLGLNRALANYEDLYNIKSQFTNMPMPSWKEDKQQPSQATPAATPQAQPQPASNAEGQWRIIKIR